MVCLAGTCGNTCGDSPLFGDGIKKGKKYLEKRLDCQSDEDMHMPQDKTWIQAAAMREYFATTLHTTHWSFGEHPPAITCI